MGVVVPRSENDGMKEGTSDVYLSDQMYDKLESVLHDMGRFSCANCLFFDKLDEATAGLVGEQTVRIDLSGFCRKHPPVVNLKWEVEVLGKNMVDGQGCWPCVDLADWCGEFKEKDQ